MSELNSLNNTADLTAEACAWIAQIESESMKSDDLAAFKEWIERSPAHKKEIMRMAQLSGELNILTDMAVPLKEAAAGQRRLANIDSRWRWPKLNYISGIIILVATIFLSDFFINHNEVSQKGPLLYATDVGSYREITLSDGTLLELNTDSKVEVDYSPERRKVRLLKGEAFFKVAHNTKRPFIVYAAEKSVRAVGTAFAVSLLPQSFEVMVTEGKVELTNTVEVEPVKEGGTSQEKRVELPTKKLSLSRSVVTPIYLEAGETVAYDQSRQKRLHSELVQSVSKREIQRKLSWQDGLLDFSETPLIEVIEDLSRYTSMKIEISDPELRNLKFGGLFRTDELAALFNALETTFNIKVEKINDSHVRLSRYEVVEA